MRPVTTERIVDAMLDPALSPSRLRARLKFVIMSLDEWEADQGLGDMHYGYVPIKAIRRWLSGAPYVG